MSSSESSDHVEPLRKRPRGEASSSAAAEASTSAPPPEEVAPFFPDPHRAMLTTLTTFTAAEHCEAFERLRGKALADSFHIDDAAIQHFQLFEEVQRLIAVGHISRLFSIQDPAYYATTMEFLSTLHLGLTSSELTSTMPRTISFRVGGVSFQLSMTEFCLAMDLYTTEEMEAAEYRDLHYEVHSFDYVALWREYSFDEAVYDARSSRAALLRSYAQRYLHRVMAHSFLEAGRASGVFGYSEFYITHCMAARIPMHLGQIIIRFLHTQSVRRQAGPTIGGGPYITRLLTGLHMRHTIPRYLRPEGSWSPLTIQGFSGSLYRQPRDREFLSQFPVIAAVPAPDAQDPPPRPVGRRRARPRLEEVVPAPPPPEASAPALPPRAPAPTPAPVLAPAPSETPPAPAPAAASSSRPRSGWRMAVTREIRRLADEQSRMADQQRRMADEQRYMRQTMGYMLQAMEIIMAHFDLVVPGSAASMRPSPPRTQAAPPAQTRATTDPPATIPDPEGSEDSLDRMLADDGADDAAP